MKIAIVSTPFVSVPPKKYGGTELFLYHLSEKLVDRGHSVTLFSTGDSRTRAELEFLYTQGRWPINPMDELTHLSFAIKRIRERNDIDLVHLNTPYALPFADTMELPAVVTLHHPRTPDYSLTYQQYPAFHYVSISQSQKNQEVPLPNFSVIHHGLDPNSYPPSYTPENYVAFLGRLAPEKGPDSAIRVAQQAGVPIHMAGAVHWIDTYFYTRQLRPLLSLPHVKWIGEADHIRKVSLLQGAKALLFPIRWEEPFGLVMIEAMLCGTPVLAFRRGSAPEIVDEGITGFLADTEEEMADIIRTKVPSFDREACRIQAVRKFSTSVMVDRYESLFQDVLKSWRAQSFSPLPDKILEETSLSNAI
ncbi:MAG: glycosyltransferase family 4 protein [Leptospirales bacterium]